MRVTIGKKPEMETFVVSIQASGSVAPEKIVAAVVLNAPKHEQDARGRRRPLQAQRFSPRSRAATDKQLLASKLTSKTTSNIFALRDFSRLGNSLRLSSGY